MGWMELDGKNVPYKPNSPENTEFPSLFFRLGEPNGRLALCLSCNVGYMV